MAEGADLSFIHLGISVQNMTKSFSIFGVSFAYYGLIIGIGMIAGLLVAQQDAKRRGQDPEIYLDFMLYGVIFAIIGARLYYVVFQWGIIRIIWRRSSIYGRAVWPSTEGSSPQWSR